VQSPVAISLSPEKLGFLNERKKKTRRGKFGPSDLSKTIQKTAAKRSKNKNNSFIHA
jgi:hypothetical protein